MTIGRIGAVYDGAVTRSETRPCHSQSVYVNVGMDGGINFPTRFSPSRVIDSSSWQHAIKTVALRISQVDLAIQWVRREVAANRILQLRCFKLFSSSASSFSPGRRQWTRS